MKDQWRQQISLVEVVRKNYSGSFFNLKIVGALFVIMEEVEEEVLSGTIPLAHGSAMMDCNPGRENSRNSPHRNGSSDRETQEYLGEQNLIYKNERFLCDCSEFMENN